MDCLLVMIPKPDLDLIHPGAPLRREMTFHSWVLRQPLLHIGTEVREQVRERGPQPIVCMWTRQPFVA
jgi:hypothetical protein